MIIMQMRDNDFADLICAQAKSLKGLFRGPQNRPATPTRLIHLITCIHHNRLFTTAEQPDKIIHWMRGSMIISEDKAVGTGPV